MTHVHGDMIDRRKTKMSNKNFKNQNRHNYNKYANKKESNSVEEKKAVVEVLEAAPLYGIVNCARLNVRRGPSIDTRSVCVVESGSELEIEYFNDEWLKVVTEDGISGYCMKKFVDKK